MNTDFICTRNTQKHNNYIRYYKSFFSVGSCALPTYKLSSLRESYAIAAEVQNHEWSHSEPKKRAYIFAIGSEIIKYVTIIQVCNELS